MSDENTVIGPRPDFTGRSPEQEKKFLIIAVVLALLTTLLVNAYIRGLERKYIGQDATREVVVAKHSISANTVIQSGHLAKKSLPKKAVSERAISPDMIDMIVGQKTRWPIKSGEAVLWTDLGMEKAGGLAHRIPKGYRSIAIGVDNIASVSGLVRPLDRVDIIGLFGGDTALTILQDVSVLSVGKVMDEEGGGGGYGTVNLLLTLDEAQMISLAQQRARLLLALRPPEEDTVETGIQRTTYSEIITQGKTVQLTTRRKDTAPADRGRVIEIIVGGRVKR